ncbi:ATP-binding cassette domain-containing protein [Aestuariivivens sp. NBU2969]|uniref:ATP-binding cassette domain-containing protein n=1 Tax=Aestuariivivens sp. NBU2969 TaxID=2873267 RepID=UPI001CBB180C|nr:ATP-binding cassette domain-containing protein [Aestuariivivens sp. NBU2969]
MNLNPHVAVFISNNSDKYDLIDTIISGNSIVQVKGLKGGLFSEITVNKYIEEERRHGHFDIKTISNNSLEHSSAGERKKALLTHIISNKPNYIIVDNIFDNLDAKSQRDIVNTLEQLSEQTLIVQIVNRKCDILSFIKNIYCLQDKSLVLVNDLEDLKNVGKKNFTISIPKPSLQILPDFNPLVKFKNVTVAYGNRTIVKDITWEINKGEFWQLLGPNGSGKSTLLSLITGDNIKAYHQDVTLFGVKKGSGESVWDIKKKIGYLSTELLRGFSRLDSIGNMIASGFFDTVGLYQTPTFEQIEIVRQWLDVLNMFEIRKRPFLSLSSGHKRLVLIARAMVKHPPLLILDEPSIGLDENDVALFSELINKIASESDTAILYVSHRKELGLNPDFMFQLTPDKMGSTGKRVQG